MAPCTHPGMKKLICPKGKKRPRLLRSLGLASLLVERYMRQGAARIAVGRVRSKKYEEKKTGKKTKKIRPTPNTPRNPQPPGDRDQLETARDQTRTRGIPYSRASSIDPGFVEISLACIHTYPHCCCCAACIRFGALFSRQRSFCFLYCDTRYVCISGFGGA